jgi:N-acyl-D-amino-acid deacylase
MDLVIRGGTVIDGSGSPGVRADVGVVGVRIARIGQIAASGAAEIDARGHVVTPGFIDAHTHMDAQVFWDRLGSSSCWHGVTSVVMGNCGFTLAPSRAGAHKLVLDNLERSEEIPADVMMRGIDWSWETFPEYLAAVERTPKAINYAAQIGHSALRTSVMGERAFGGVPTDADLAAMCDVAAEAVRAGAFGFTTSISDHHETPDGRPVASRYTSWDELTAIVEATGRAGAEVFQLAVDTERTETDDVEVATEFWDRLRRLARDTRMAVTYGLRSQHLAVQLDMFDRAAQEGARMFGQCQSHASALLYSLTTGMPFDGMPAWRAIRGSALSEQLARLRDPGVHAELAAAMEASPGRRPIGSLVPLSSDFAGRTVEQLAVERGVTAAEALLDLLCEGGPELLFAFAPTAAAEEAVLTAMRHPHTVMTFSDAGAHVRRMSGADMQTTLLARWVRERKAFTLEAGVEMITSRPARAWRIPERGLLQEGMVADINVFDPDRIAPDLPYIAHDLPGGAARIVQRAVGLHSTVVAGREVFREGEHTGELPGRLLRGPGAAH